MMSYYDILLELLLAAAVFAVMMILSKNWENQRACRVADNSATPREEENPEVQDKTPPLTAEKSQKTPDKLSLTVKVMGSEKPLVIETSPSERVIDVKLKIQEIEGTNVKSQRLIFCGSPLQNESVLRTIGVVDGSVMHFLSTKKPSIQLYIKQLTGHIFVVNGEEDETVTDLKRKIEILEGTPFDSIRLIYAGKQLEDKHLLRHYNLKDLSTVHMLLRLRGGFTVNIRISDGRTLSLGLFDTIRELKNMIYEKSGIHVHHQELLFHGTVLENGYHRKDYNIESNCTLDLIIQRGG